MEAFRRLICHMAVCREDPPRKPEVTDVVVVVEVAAAAEWKLFIQTEISSRLVGSGCIGLKVHHVVSSP